MSVEENKALVRRYYSEVYNKGNMAAVDQLVAPGYVNHNAFPGEGGGVNGIKQTALALRTGFPDWHESLEDLIAEGDKVACRVTAQGTHRGEFMGVAPKGTRVTVTGIDILRVANGRIQERWGEVDVLGLMRQLGIINAP